MDRLDRMLALMSSRVPGAGIAVKSDSPAMRALGRALAPINPEFDTRYVTAIGRTVWLPRPIAAWNRDDLAQVLGHELVHLDDQRRYGAAFYLSYGVGLPVWRTARAVWERRGYAVDLLIAQERAGDVGVTRMFERIVPLFAGPAYGWMWGGEAAARAFLAPTAAAVRDGSLGTTDPYDAILAAWRGP